MTVRVKKGRLLAESYFADILCRERKRSERSARILLLMLVDFRHLLKAGCHNKTIQRIPSELVPCVRETDIVGWHKDSMVLGIIFTELGHAPKKEEVIHAILQRVRAAIQTIIDPDMVPLALHFFPQDSHDDDDPLKRNFYPDLVQQSPLRKATHAIKRSVDVTASTMGILVLLPLWICVSLVIKLTSKGPVFYRQTRLGEGGRAFAILKFRTMRLNNDDRVHRDYVGEWIAGAAKTMHSTDARQPAYKLVDDARITTFGRWLRRTSIDEIPQLINVFRGEMSLVGPRPPLPYEFQRYAVWHRRRVLEMKPGMTGLWQVNGRTRTTFAEMVRLDLRYARQWSLWLDFKILLKTPKVVFLGDGAF